MKNRLSRKTREQFEELLEAVYQEGLEEGKASVDKFGFKTEKRVAKVGERFIVTKPSFTFGDYKKGDVFTVLEHFGDGVIAKELREKLGEDEPYICHGEYEVIIELESPQYETGKRRAMSGERVLIVNAKPLITQYKNGDVFTVTEVSDSDVDVEENDNICLFHEEYEVIIEPEQAPVIEEFPDELTPNEQRAELIEKAKSFVEVNTRKKTSSFQKISYFVKSNLGVVEEFIVNEEKRTVVCLLKGARVPKVYFKGIAKCMPGEVFNADIGKAIALARALEIDVPQEFMNAVQPTGLAKGQAIRYTCNTSNSGEKRVISYFDDEKVRFDCKRTFYIHDHRYADDLIGDILNIIDDTNAKYGENE